MSAQLEDMYNSIIFKRVPANWTVAGYLSLRPLDSWFVDLLKRVEFFKVWLAEGRLPSYWVSAFYFPQGFMTAVLQTYARKYEIAIDELVFKTVVQSKFAEEITEIPEDGNFLAEI
jgi:dynein heavy chain